jgi:LmbE family N-acetylglucosaminyl deacetylase
VLSATGRRAAEAEASAAAFLAGAAHSKIQLGEFQDSFFPYQGADIKPWLKGVKAEFEPDVILTHARHDAHQDHREICQLTWNVFRNHLILEYEIPKWDGDLGQPNVYLPLTSAVLERKVDLLLTHFGTQRSKDWFEAETFTGLARLRGMECRAREGYAEAFVMRKGSLG